MTYTTIYLAVIKGLSQNHGYLLSKMAKGTISKWQGDQKSDKTK